MQQMPELIKPNATLSRVVGATVIGSLICLLVDCAAGTPGAMMPMNTSNVVVCTTVTDCQNSTHVPMCTNPLSMTCHLPYTGAPNSVCFFRLKDAPGCMCLENDVQLCTQSGGAAGIQTCVKVPNTTNTTYWAACGPLT
jgi:hypothetical protein